MLFGGAELIFTEFVALTSIFPSNSKHFYSFYSFYSF